MRSIRVLAPAALLLAACHGQPPAAGPAPAPALSPAEQAAYQQADSVRKSYTQADIDFMTGMIAHHSQAIIMSRWAPTHGASPAMLRLTERIINAQQDEIALMQRWLRDRGQPVPDPLGGHDQMAGMDHSQMAGMDHGQMGMPHLMPGMLTPEQMQALDAARGPAFDRLFLTYMIQHHSGALTMVDKLFSTPGAGIEDQIFKLASDVHTDQTTEIARMELMLDAMGGPAPGGQ